MRWPRRSVPRRPRPAYSPRGSRFRLTRLSVGHDGGQAVLYHPTVHAWRTLVRQVQQLAQRLRTKHGHTSPTFTVVICGEYLSAPPRAKEERCPAIP